MRLKKLLLTTILGALLISLSCVGQTKITGTIVESGNRKPIPFVNVVLTNSGFGTITNNDGEFELTSFSANDSVSISHISFESKKIKLTYDLGVISLKPKTTFLPEIVVTNVADQYVKKVVNAAISHLNVKNYGKAFYRQITTNNDSIPVEIQEVFYALETTNAGVERKSIEESRYAIKKHNDQEVLPLVKVGNFSALMLASKIISTETVDKKLILIPVMHQSENYYDFTIVERIKDDDKEYLKIEFNPLPESTKPALKGDMIINPTTNHVLRMDITLVNNLGMDKVKFHNGQVGNTFNHLYEFTFDFTEKESGVELNYILGSNHFDVKTEKGEIIHVDVNASLVVFQKGLKKIKKLEEASLTQNDIEQLKKKKYNPAFWKENPIIKRTPIENKIIERFEKDGSFGTLFNTTD